MLDAGAAVLGAVGAQARISLNSSAPQPLELLTFSAAPTLVPNGRSIVAYRWVLTDGGGIVGGFSGATDSATAFATPSAAGQFSVSLTVTDNTGARSTATSTVAVVAPSVGDGGGGGGALSGAWLLLLGFAVLALRATAGQRRPG